MSARQKLRLQQRLQVSKMTIGTDQENEEDDDDSLRIEDAGAAVSRKNIYLLAADASSDTDANDASDANDECNEADTVAESKFIAEMQPQTLSSAMGAQEVESSHKPTKQRRKHSNQRKKKPQQYEESIESLYREIDGLGPLDGASPALGNKAIFFEPFKLFCIDDRNLDIDKLMKKRFGLKAVATEPDVDEGGGGRPGRKPRLPKMVVNKRCVFGIPRDEWSKPPGLAAGGYALSRCVEEEAFPVYYRAAQMQTGVFDWSRAVWFQMRWSDEYIRLNDEYKFVQESGDANQLVLFLSRHPYHLDGLLQLGIVFARTGQMDRAADLVRRCLFCLEMSFPENFHPTRGENHRIDPTRLENACIFNSLFRHMQMTNMLGCPGVATEVGVYLFALCPDGDPMHVLLTLDHFMLCAGRLEQLLGWTGANIDAIAEATLDLSALRELIGAPYLVEKPWNWTCPIYLGESPFALASDHTVASASATATVDMPSRAAVDGDSQYSLIHLPNWWFSLSLAAFNREQQAKKAASGDVSSVAHNLLIASLVRWPFVLHLLVDCRKVGIEGKSIGWRSALSHPFFAKALDRVPLKSPLRHIANIYILRNSTLWNREEVHAWALQAATAVVANPDISNQLMEQQCKFYELLSSIPAIQKYSNAVEEDFMEDFPRFPPEANPLDPQFADPRMLARHNIRPHHGDIRMRQVRGRRGDGGEAFGAGVIDRRGRVNAAALEEELERLRDLGVELTAEELVAQLQGLANPARDATAMPGAEGALEVDLDAPLMQLFLQTMLPWYDLPQHPPT